MVDVANNYGEQAEEEDDSCGVDDWVQRPDAWRQIFHTAEVLQEKRTDKPSGEHNLSQPISNSQTSTKCPDFSSGNFS